MAGQEHGGNRQWLWQLLGRTTQHAQARASYK